MLRHLLSSSSSALRASSTLACASSTWHQIHHPKVMIMESTCDEKIRSCIATEEIEAGELIQEIEGRVVPEKSRYTIQIRPDVHFSLSDGFQYTNHSCSPNTKLAISEYPPSIKMVALKPILPNEHLSFDYNTTEWDMAEPFECNCNSSNCQTSVHGQLIRGAKHLSPATLEEKVEFFSPSILRSLCKDYIHSLLHK